MLVVGLIGRIGAGKSTVARLLAAKGADVIDADRIAHEQFADEDVRRTIAARFGAGVLAADGSIDRAALARLVFGPTAAHEAALRDLEAIVHPRVRRRIEAELDRLGRLPPARGGRRVVVLDVPLLVRAGWAERCDRLLVVECDDAERRRRLAGRGWTAEQQAAREAAWNRGSAPPRDLEPKILRVDASGDPTYTSQTIDRTWTDLQRL
ncbi:MAG: Dephospho-CoA kinase [Planctomycetota bacterium]|jgi:dephospho-CoA kinase